MQAKGIQSSVVSRQESFQPAALNRSAGVPPAVARASRPRSGKNDAPAQLRNPCSFCGECRRDRLCRFTLHARTQQFSFNLQPVQKLRVSWAYIALS